MGIKSFLSRVGHSVNRGFNSFKHHARAYIPSIKRISAGIYAAGKYASVLPAVHPVAAVAKAGLMAAGEQAGVVGKAALGTELGLNAAEQFQKDMGWDTQFRQDNG